MVGKFPRSTCEMLHDVAVRAIYIIYIYVCMQLNAYIDVDAYRSLYLDMLNIFWLCRHATYTLQCASRRCVHAGAHAVQWRSGTGVPHVPLFCYHLKGFLRDLKGVSMYLCSVSSLWMMRVPEKKQTTNPLPFIFQPRQKSL